MSSRTETDRTQGNVEFISSHVPAILPGDYTIQVTQALDITGPAAVNEQYVGRARRFRVQPPDGRLNPQQIRAVYPPEGGLGEYVHNLPHIVLTPSTLPWEKSGLHPPQSDTPWLILLLFTEAEYRQVEHSQSPAGNDSDRPAVATIKVPAPLLNRAQPQMSELKLLAHVRQSVDASGKIEGDEVAVIMGNRIPSTGNNVVHLVAIDGLYSADGPLPAAGDAVGMIELRSLKSWRFASTDPEFGFVRLLTRLDRGLLQHTETTHILADQYLKQGASLLPHHMRLGNKTASWYRGPLLPGHLAPAAEISFPVRSADDLIRFNEEMGLFDVSYAVAWELGRLLMLNSKGAALDLYHWKQANAQRIKAAEQQIGHLPFDGPSDELELPASVTNWFERTAQLEGIPFHNLVVDEALLPEESIRFFEIDWHWIECLLDGAFSIGRVTELDHHRERSMSEGLAKPPERRMTGFLLRSAVVAGHPDLQVVGSEKPLSLSASETELLFEVNHAGLGNLLRTAAAAEQGAGAEIQTLFGNAGYPLGDQFTVDERAWFILNDGFPMAELTQTFNNRIDVRVRDGLATPWSYAGQIDASLEPALRDSRRSRPLIRAFAQINVELPEEFSMVGSRWILSGEAKQIYLVERNENGYNIYQEYRNPLLRYERLSSNVLIGIFEGQIGALDFHLMPEALHHGFNTDKARNLIKFRRDQDGVEQRDSKPIPVAFSKGDARTIDMAALAGALTQSNEPAEFALQMIEGVPTVRFTL